MHLMSNSKHKTGRKPLKLGTVENYHHHWYLLIWLVYLTLFAKMCIRDSDEGARDEAQEHHGDQHQADDPAAGAAVFGFHKCGYLPVYTFRNLRMESKLPNTPTRKPVSA